MVMPLRVALYDPQGNARPNEELILLSDQKQTFHFDGFSAAPILSINRGFSAPVIIDTNRSQNDLAFLSAHDDDPRSEEHTSELQSLMRHSYAVFCLKKKTNNT